VGKTEIAKVLATSLGRPLIRLQCYEGLDVASPSMSGTIAPDDRDQGWPKRRACTIGRAGRGYLRRALSYPPAVAGGAEPAMPKARLSC